MAAALTRAQMRDAIRRDLQKKPAVDDGTGVSGDASTKTPEPTNELINQKLDEAISFINAEVGLQVADAVTITVTGTTTAGTQSYDLDAVDVDTTSGTSLQNINDIKHVEFDDGTTKTPLTPASFDDFDRRGLYWQQTAASRPVHFLIRANKLHIWPASTVSGTLRIIAGTGMIGYTSDSATLTQVPTDYHPAVQYTADALIAATKPTDTEMIALRAVYEPLSAHYIGLLRKNKVRRAAQFQPRLTVRRPFCGTRR